MTNRPRGLWPALLIALPVLTALTFAASGKLGGTIAETNTSNQVVTNPSHGHYVRRSLLSPKLVRHLDALGDRLERPGRERLNLKGTLSWTNDSQPEEISAVLEFSERLRLTIQKGNQTRTLTFNGERPKSGVNSLEARQRDLLETLAYGSAEHFFATQMQSRATRFLGSRFRLDDGSTANYAGPYYEVYKVAEQVTTSATPEGQVRLYYFNSDTLLLERVTYEITRDGSTVKVEERLGEWTKEQGQQVARRIERVENGKSMFVLTIQSVGLSQQTEDGIFIQ